MIIYDFPIRDVLLEDKVSKNANVNILYPLHLAPDLSIRPFRKPSPSTSLRTAIQLLQTNIPITTISFLSTLPLSQESPHGPQLKPTTMLHYAPYLQVHPLRLHPRALRRPIYPILEHSEAWPPAQNPLPCLVSTWSAESLISLKHLQLPYHPVRGFLPTCAHHQLAPHLVSVEAAR